MSTTKHEPQRSRGRAPSARGAPRSAKTASAAATRSGAPAKPDRAATRSGAPAKTGGASTKNGAPAKTGGASTRSGAPAKTGGASTRSGAPAKSGRAPTKDGAAAKTGRGPTRTRAAGAAPRRRRPMAPPVETLDLLRVIHPDAHCELDHEGAFQLLVATVLSAQTTDVNVNKATPALFARFPDAGALARAEPAEVEPYISTLGFFRQKSKSLVGLSRRIVDTFGGEVPRRLDDLVTLPGVGRKTANVVLGVVWNSPEGVVVDTHVQRISQRLGWTHHTDPVKIEQDLMQLLPKDHWDMTSHLLIFHGRRVCFARKPNCAGCGLNAVCPSAFHAENVGRKPKRERRA